MVVEGYGIVWLLVSVVFCEIVEGKLILVIVLNDSEVLEQGLWCDEMDICVYCCFDGVNLDIDWIWNYFKVEYGML